VNIQICTSLANLCI